MNNPAMKDRVNITAELVLKWEEFGGGEKTLTLPKVIPITRELILDLMSYNTVDTEQEMTNLVCDMILCMMSDIHSMHSDYLHYENTEDDIKALPSNELMEFVRETIRSALSAYERSVLSAYENYE